MKRVIKKKTKLVKEITEPTVVRTEDTERCSEEMELGLASPLVKLAQNKMVLFIRI